jgi:hypothetical protein
MKKFLGVVFVLMLLAPMALLAQDDVPVDVDTELVAAILAAFGVGVLGLTQIIKNVLKVPTWQSDIAKKIAGYGISLVVSAAGTIFTLTTTGQMALGKAILYTAVVWGIANGWWKGLKELIAKHR